MAQVTDTIVAAPVPVPVRIARRAWRLRRLPLIPMFILGVFVVTGIFAPWIAPHDPVENRLKERNIPPAWMSGEVVEVTVVAQDFGVDQDTEMSLRNAKRKLKIGEATFVAGGEDREVKVGDRIAEVIQEGGTWTYPLGTDHLGRDILSRIVFGARISLVVVAVTLGIGVVIGVVSGLVAGWYGGWVDELFMRVVDIKLAIPTILLALVLIFALGQTFLIIIVVLAIAVWPRFARNVRGEVLQLKTMDYVALAQVAGASTPRILFIHIFPGVINTLIILATLEVGIVILLESTLSFLGAGVPPPTPAWGSMVSDGRDLLLAGGWWVSTMPGLAIMLVVLSMNIFGDWLRDKLDPRLRQLE